MPVDIFNDEHQKSLKPPPTSERTELASDNDDKSRILFDTFFPSPANPPPSHSQYEYPEPLGQYRPITDEQIYRVISKLSPYKAPGPNEVSNAVLTHNANLLVPYLGPLFRATFDLGVYPEQWKRSITVVLRKPGRPDYSLAKAYRPIALLDTIAKVLTACVAQDLTYLAEHHNMLPTNHFGGRPGRTTTDAIHLQTKFIKDAWARSKVVAALYLDVKGAFPNVNVPTLIHNMRKRGVPKKYTDWIEERLRGRSTTLSFDNYNSPPFTFENGLDQGCPLSVILYLFYNADLVDEALPNKSELKLGFIDDVTYAAEAPTVEEACAKVRNMVIRTGGAADWAIQHNSPLELDKLGLVIFTRRRQKPTSNQQTTENSTTTTTPPEPSTEATSTPAEQPPPQLAPEEPNMANTTTVTNTAVPTPTTIDICGVTVKPSPTWRFLGIIMDRELRFREHQTKALAKGTERVYLANRLARTTRGIAAPLSRKIFLAVVVPAMLYGADIFCTPIQISSQRGKRSSGSAGFAKKIERVQRLAAIQSTGGMRTTPNDALSAHADLLPTHLLINKTCYRSALRIASLPKTHPLAPHAARAANQYRKRHRSPLHELMKTLPHKPNEIETIDAYRKSPKWRRPFKAIIEQDEEKAIENCRKEQRSLRLYSDGSGHDGHVGASAVLIRPNRPPRTLRYYLGTAAEHTVYEAELVGMILATELLKTERPPVRRVLLSVDNQAAICSTNSISSSPAHYLTDKFLEHLKLARLKHPGAAFRINWVPGHAGEPGNERADSEAKEAASGRPSAQHLLPTFLRKPLPISKTALKQDIYAKLNRSAKQYLRAAPRAQRMRRIDATYPSNKFRKLTRYLPRSKSSLLTQLRTGHIPLAKHLHRIKILESPICQNCKRVEETVHHYLHICPAYAQARHERDLALRSASRETKALLTKTNCLRHLFDYIRATGRFSDTHGNLTEKRPHPE